MRQKRSAQSTIVPVHISSAQFMALINAMRIRIGTRNAPVADTLVIRKRAVGLELVHRGYVAALTLLRRPKLMQPCRRIQLAQQGTR